MEIAELLQLLISTFLRHILSFNSKLHKLPKLQIPKIRN